MKTVRLKDHIVVEIIPPYALPVENWYGDVFASQCAEAPEEVQLGWIYDSVTKTFNEPASEPEAPPDPTIEERFVILEAENACLTAKLNASIQSSQFLEDCLAEMAEIVYA